MKFKCSLAFNFLAIFLQTNFWIHLLYYWLLDGIYSIFFAFSNQFSLGKAQKRIHKFVCKK